MHKSYKWEVFIRQTIEIKTDSSMILNLKEVISEVGKIPLTFDSAQDKRDS